MLLLVNLKYCLAEDSSPIGDAAPFLEDDECETSDVALLKLRVQCSSMLCYVF